MSDSEHFEYAVVGGGKGGKTLAIELAASGHRTVMIERGLIGGSCIRVACIPSKTMVRSAKVMEFARRAANYGIEVASPKANMAAVRQHKQAVVDGLTEVNWKQFVASGMTFLLGTARFVGPRAIEVQLAEGGTRQILAERVVINTGTRPYFPPIPGLAEAGALSSQTLMELDYLPEHLLILGGGYIALEFAQMFRRFGSRVTLLVRGEQLVAQEDADIAAEILKIFKEDGIEVLFSTDVQRVERTATGLVRLSLSGLSGETSVEGSDLLVATGRIPNTENLNLAAAGVDVDERGYVVVNERLEATAPNTWAVGDVNGGPQFTHISLDDYRIVAANLRGGHRSTRDRLVPSTIFIDPELGRVGLTEKEALRQGYTVRVARLPMTALQAAQTRGETRGMMKAVIDAGTDKILGVALLCAEGGEVATVVQVAMRAGLPYTYFRDEVLPHPTMAEGLNALFSSKKMESRSPDSATAPATSTTEA